MHSLPVLVQFEHGRRFAKSHLTYCQLESIENGQGDRSTFFLWHITQAFIIGVLILAVVEINGMDSLGGDAEKAEFKVIMQDWSEFNLTDSNKSTTRKGKRLFQMRIFHCFRGKCFLM